MHDVEGKRRVCKEVCCWQWRKIKFCELTDVLDLNRPASVAKSGIVDGKAASGSSCRSTKHTAECEEEKRVCLEVCCCR